MSASQRDVSPGITFGKASSVSGAQQRKRGQVDAGVAGERSAQQASTAGHQGKLTARQSVKTAGCQHTHRSKMVLSTARAVRVPRLPIHRWRVGSRDCARTKWAGGRGEEGAQGGLEQ